MAVKSVRMAFPPFVTMVSIPYGSGVKEFGDSPWSKLQLTRVDGSVGHALLHRVQDLSAATPWYLDALISVQLPWRNTAPGLGNFEGVVGDSMEGEARIYAGGSANIHFDSGLLTFVMTKTMADAAKNSYFPRAVKQFAKDADGEVVLAGFIPLASIAQLVSDPRDKRGDVRLLVGNETHPAAALVPEDLEFNCSLLGSRPTRRTLDSSAPKYRQAKSKQKLDAITLLDILRSEISKAKESQPERAEIGSGLVVERWPDRDFSDWLQDPEH